MASLLFHSLSHLLPACKAVAGSTANLSVNHFSEAPWLKQALQATNTFDNGLRMARPQRRPPFSLLYPGPPRCCGIVSGYFSHVSLSALAVPLLAWFTSTEEAMIPFVIKLFLIISGEGAISLSFP